METKFILNESQRRFPHAKFSLWQRLLLKLEKGKAWHVASNRSRTNTTEVYLHIMTPAIIYERGELNIDILINRLASTLQHEALHQALFNCGQSTREGNVIFIERLVRKEKLLMSMFEEWFKRSLH